MLNKIVLTYGTFDLFHIGHLNLLERARALGDYLIVGVSTDQFNEEKGKKCFFGFPERSRIVQACRYVDQVIPEIDWEQKLSDIQKFNVNIFTMGDDWVGKFDELEDVCKVVYLPRTPGISSSQIRKLSESNRDGTMVSKLKTAVSLLNTART